MSSRALGWIWTLLLVATMLLLLDHMMKEAVACKERGGVYVRTVWSYQCIKGEPR